MKKLLNRLRRWLIRRLGGWDVIPVGLSPRDGLRFYQHTDYHPAIFTADIEVGGDYMSDRERLLAWARERVTETVLNQLAENGAVVIDQRCTPIKDTTILRARVVAFVGTEAEEYINRHKWRGEP